MNEVMLGFAYLRGVLGNDGESVALAPGGIHRAMVAANSGIPTPYIVLIHQSGTDAGLFRAVRGFTDMLFQVKAVGPAKNTQALVDCAGRIDTVITTADEVAITGGVIKTCYRYQPLEMDELEDTVQWTNLGGLYRVVARSN